MKLGLRRINQHTGEADKNANCYSYTQICDCCGCIIRGTSTYSMQPPNLKCKDFCNECYRTYYNWIMLNGSTAANEARDLELIKVVRSSISIANRNTFNHNKRLYIMFIERVPSKNDSSNKTYLYFFWSNAEITVSSYIDYLDDIYEMYKHMGYEKSEIAETLHKYHSTICTKAISIDDTLSIRRILAENEQWVPHGVYK